MDLLAQLHSTFGVLAFLCLIVAVLFMVFGDDDDMDGLA